MRRASYALLLTGVALAAVPGCITVPASGRPAPATPAPGATPAESATAPARESITRPDRPPPVSPRPSARGRTVAPGPPPRPRPTGSPPVPADLPRPPREGDPFGVVPEPVASLAAGTDACALAEAYGGWQPGSAIGRTCRETRGHGAPGRP
ncbi:hypothetical protein [Streptomyces sp. WMMC1477]|uniref:hypothetical protein n=1 Tax=Streptomyces sp. WMMC1477 TaxID=3015155 RepID=UPI0022B6B985|nr:hypothetical protein [Streptomyces sp. WMMC1477]MCZ7434666.1 hypothetical protein [Streptomyces sp. WMMC1477]